MSLSIHSPQGGALGDGKPFLTLSLYHAFSKMQEQHATQLWFSLAPLCKGSCREATEGLLIVQNNRFSILCNDDNPSVTPYGVPPPFAQGRLITAPSKGYLKLLALGLTGVDLMTVVHHKEDGCIEYGFAIWYRIFIIF